MIEGRIGGSPVGKADVALAQALMQTIADMVAAEALMFEASNAGAGWLYFTGNAPARRLERSRAIRPDPMDLPAI
jgi:hypothetical protein